MSISHLQADHVTRRFKIGTDTLTALDDVSVDVAKGEFVTIVGASGCGKSTLLRLLAGLDAATAGQIRHAGADVSEPSLNRGIVFQEPRLFPWLTVEQNVALGLLNTKLVKARKAELVREHLELVGLGGFATVYPHQLSGGMAQRAGIARGLVSRPNVLLLDEPFGALDAITKARLQDELQEIWAKEGVTMVLVTHDVEEAVYLGDRVVVMSPRPGRVREIVPVTLERPRRRTSAETAAVRDRVLTSLHATGEAGTPVSRPAQMPEQVRPRPAIAIAR
ncbi:ABC transporter ATP-binding protein [Rhizobium sp. Root1220]|uniref:ABC transporter ATP-binding protein n=1 Tax=Rhizobium sp. Root1220 TaxID=1736432 RepID=UPI0006F74CA7|nr:ABC transporter ATP-binding protein [Rhizobium sp. Root1220]KQV84418.1 sulfonate ABC transporter ATP-binding protein [Rhizobium sp. Root1220]